LLHLSGKKNVFFFKSNFWQIIINGNIHEDAINRANGSKSENKEEKSDKHENLLEAKSKTPNKKKGRRKKYFDEAERSENEINENTCLSDFSSLFSLLLPFALLIVSST
jgi:hypothetical protein